MPNQYVANDGLPKRRPLHVSVASLGTNASGLAESTISFAGSDFSVSLFPAPPTEVPTPTSSFGAPTIHNFTERFPASIPEYGTPSRFRFGTPPSPLSPSASFVSGNSSGQGTRSVRSAFTTRSDGPHDAVKVVEDPLAHNKQYTSSPLASLPSRPSATYQPTSPLAYRKNPALQPPVTERAFVKRPETPRSVAAASSLLDWSDATSGISINPSEERLLTTSFITSLLSQAPDPFPAEKLSRARSRATRGLDERKDDVSSHASRDGAANNAVTSHQFSDPLSADGREVLDSRATPSDDRRSLNSGSRRTSKDYSETLHSGEEQVQSVTRRPSITVNRGGVEAHPVAVMPAFRISHSGQSSDRTSNSFMTLTNSVITSTSMASKPPIHRADAPRNVRRTDGIFDHSTPRESDEDFVKVGSADLFIYQEQPKIAGSPLAATGSQYRFGHTQSKSQSDMNQASSSQYPLRRNQSRKSVVSSLVSRISNKSTARREQLLAWLKHRPLPPIPKGSNHPPEFPYGREIQRSEEAIPLPTLAKRADDLSGMLSRGRFAAGEEVHHEFYYKEGSGHNDEAQLGNRDAYVQIDEGRTQRHSLFRRRKEESDVIPHLQSPSSAKFSAFDRRRTRRRLWIVAFCVIIGAAVAIAVPVVLSQRKSSTVVCHGNQTGVSCTLDATCVCTGSSGSCRPLARSLYLLVPDVNELFAANFSLDEMSDAVVSAVGDSPNGLCADQAQLIDVEPGLDSAAAPNRTKWAQAAILWNLGMSEDISAATALQKFVSTAPWDGLSSVDGPDDDTNGIFACNASGFTFDFASQSIAPPSASFRQSSPSGDQIGELSDTAEKVLDRMYSFAIASSRQREKAFNNYWTSVLQRQQTELDAFLLAVQNAPFLVPFDATLSPGGDALTNLMTTTSSTQFPVPISCYPGLGSTHLDRINTLETSVFGLDTALGVSQFSQSCFPDRPVYGVVDLLNLRLPFPDDKKGVALQASALSKDATTRAVIYSGEVLSSLPGATVLPNITASTTDPREFGTSDFLYHVLLNYFSSISNTSLAMDLVSQVLSSTIPAVNSDLANSLSTLPILEFAVFGTLKPQDIAFSVSSFSSPTDSLFFGSDAGEKFRSWALVNTSSSIAWAESALSFDVVHEGSSADPNLESVWKPASELVASGATDADDVQRVTSSLRSLGLFSP